MKSLLLAAIILLHFAASAQSPYLSILVKMDSAKAEFTRYKIEMKICKPKKMTEKGGWFTHDTSNINFASLKAADIKCDEYFDKGMPERISGQEEERPINQFEFGNQVFAWEEIYVFKISNRSSRGWYPEMYIVIPIKYKSFRTYIDITDIEFQSGKVIFLTNANTFYDESKLNIRQSLKNEKGTQVKDFFLREILEGK
jgi:hypothetical protein